MANKINCLHYRVVLLGSPGVGKTSILNRFLFKKYEPKYKATVEDLFTKTFELGCIDLEVNFLDTSGSMQFPAMRRLNITNGDAFLIVYAVDNEESFDSIKLCMDEIREIRQDYQEIPIVFAGNKCDIPRENRKLLKETISEYVYYELPRLRAKVVECSCKENWNIDNIFRAYLSLARVNLSSSSALPQAAPMSISQRSKHHQQRGQQQDCNCNGSGGHTTPSTPPPTRKSAELLNKNSNDASANGNNNTNNNSSNNNDDNVNSNRRSSSMKVGLGSRKNYDLGSSILISRMSNCNLNDTASPKRTNNFGSPMRRGFNEAVEKGDIINGEVNLDTAVRWRMSAEHQAKPRSRSLIWRTSRKNRQNNPNESNCYPT